MEQPNDWRDIDQMMRIAVSHDSARLALTDGEISLSWGEFDQQINQVASALEERGLGPGSTIAVLAHNSIDYVCLLFGASRIGVCIAPLSTLASGEALAAMIDDSGAELLFLGADLADEFLPYLDRLSEMGEDQVIALDGAIGALWQFEAFLAAGSSSPLPLLDLDANLPFNLIYSSGTTGTPKGIIQDRRFRSTECRDMAAGYIIYSGARTIVATPLCSNSTLFSFLSVMAAGGAAYVMRKFDAGRFCRIAEKFRPTHQVLVPVQYDRILALDDFESFDLSSFVLKYVTSAPFREAQKRAVLDRWPAGGLIEFYGMTEGGVSVTLVAHLRPDKLDTVGVPSEGCEIRVINDSGEEVPDGKVGEIVGYAPRIMQGYHNRQGATDEASWYDEEGRRFHRSGDVGWVDEDGFVHLLDRKKDMIITGGFNVYADDLEKALLEDDRVSEAAVIGMPSPEWGETPVAFVVCAASDEAASGSIRDCANSRLGKVQRISEVRIVEELPRSPIGKILKTELRKLL